jgi:hypothetical protein
MPQRLRVTLLSMVLAAAFLIGGAPQCQAATKGNSPKAVVTAQGWLSAVWAAVQAQAIPNGGKQLGAQRGARQTRLRGLPFLVEEGCVINPNGAK